MKKLSLILILLTSSVFCLADGDSHVRVDFTIEMMDGSMRKGYSEMFSAEQYSDSLKSSHYLMRRLTKKYRVDDSDILDTLLYYTDVLEYHYYRPNEYDSATYTIYMLVNEAVIDFADIRQIRIDQFHEYGCGGIVNPLTMADTLWMNKMPVRFISLTGELCVFTVLVHEINPETEAVIRELLARQHSMRQAESSENYEEREQSVDQDFFELLEKLKGQKVVIVESCSC